MAGMKVAIAAKSREQLPELRVDIVEMSMQNNFDAPSKSIIQVFVASM